MSRTQWATYEQSMSLVKQDGGGQPPKKPLGRPRQALTPTRGSPLVAAPISPGPTAAPHLPSLKAHSGSAGPSCGCQGEVSDAYFGFSPETLLPEGQDGLVGRVCAAGTPENLQSKIQAGCGWVSWGVTWWVLVISSVFLPTPPPQLLLLPRASPWCPLQITPCLTRGRAGCGGLREAAGWWQPGRCGEALIREGG